ncbi:MAG: hypothetical protein LBU48_03250 [Coriobacteriales bacterium]|jgi:hypothetical protein|nr:hypothetical protein [Coriobacteriales bacterium]
MTIDWRKGNREDICYGVLVDPVNLDKEFERVDIGEFSISSNYYTDERVSGQISPPPSFRPVGNRLLRIYMESTAQNGERAKTELGTFFMRRTQTTLSKGAKVRDIELHSTIWKYVNDWCLADYLWPAGTDALAALMSQRNKTIGTIDDIRGVKPVRLREPVAWQSGTNALKIANWFADYLGAEALNVDTHGRIFITPYILPDKRPVVWTFEDGVNCMYVDEYIVDSNEDDIPNYVAINLRNGDYCYKAKRLLPASSPYSVEQRGRLVTAHYEYSELPLAVGDWAICTRAGKIYQSKDTASAVVHETWVGGGSRCTKPQEGEWLWVSWQQGQYYYGWAKAKDFVSIDAADKRADAIFSKILSLAISIEIQHHYAPIKIGDAVRFKRGNTDIVGIVHAMEMEGTSGLVTNTVLDVLGGALGDVYP